MTEQAWERLLKDSTPKWADHDNPAIQVNLDAALKELTRRERLVVEIWYEAIVLPTGVKDSRANEVRVNKLTRDLLASEPPDLGTPFEVDVVQVHAYRMKALAKLKRPDVQRVLRRQPETVAA